MKPISLVALALALAGCGTTADLRRQIDQNQIDNQKRLEAPAVQPGPPSRVSQGGQVALPVTEIPVQRHSWLSRLKVTIGQVSKPLPLAAIVEKFAAQGINIAADLPLDAYSFAGTVNPTDAETALRQVLGSVGLDYEVDEARRLVTIKPLSTRTWYLNVGNRKSQYSSQDASQSGSAGTGGQAGGAGGLAGLNAGAASAFPGGGLGASQNGLSNPYGGAPGANGGASGAGLATGSASTGVSSSDDFWGSLSDELKKRLTLLLPTGRHAAGAPLPAGPYEVPAIPTAASAGAGQDTELFASKKIGDFAVNPETGAITVQAPRWLLEDLDSYLKGVQTMYNTALSFHGELVFVSSTHSNSEGFDISSFGRFASGRYNAIVSNNALGGVTVSFPGTGSNVPSVVPGAQAVRGALLGVSSPLDGLQIFNAYLESLGKVSVMQKPLVTTTSGVPGEFSKVFKKYYNTTSQQAAPGGTGSAVQATTNTLLSKDFGIVLRINPRYDATTGLIRAQLSLNNTLPAGEDVVDQTISVGNSFKTIPTRIPLDTQLKYSGEALLRDGDLVIVGGQSEENLQVDEAGLPGFDAPTGGAFGTKNGSKISGTFYFALRVSVHPRS